LLYGITSLLKLFIIPACRKAIKHIMFKSIGFILVLYAITQMMSGTFEAFQGALTATFETVETAAQVSKTQIELAQ